MSKGYVRLPVDFPDEWEWWDEHNTTRLFLFCMMRANHKPKKWRGITIERGQFVTSLARLSEGTSLSVQTVRTCLNRLKSTHQLTCKSTSKMTVVTICEYDTYGGLGAEANTPINTPINKQLTNHQQTTNKQLTTTKIKKRESLREEKKEELILSWDSIKDWWNDRAATVNAPAIKKLTADRRMRFKARMTKGKYPNADVMTAAIDAALEGVGSFLIEGSWFTFDWLFKNDGNLNKLLEGNYKPRATPTTGQVLEGYQQQEWVDEF